MELSERTKKNLSLGVGIPFERILELSPEDEIELVSQKHGGQIVFPRKRGRMSFRTMRDVDRKIIKITKTRL